MKAVPYKKIFRISSYIVFLLCSLPCFSEGESAEARGASRELDFAGEPVIDSSQKIKDWVQEELSEKLGLEGGDVLQVVPGKKELNNYSTVLLNQTYKNIDVIGLESRLVLDAQERPLFLLGKHKSYSEGLAEDPRFELTQALEKAGHVESSEFSSRLVYWTESYENPELSYELEGHFTSNEQGGHLSFERVYVSALSGEVLQRISLIHSSKRRRVNDFGAACKSMRINGPINDLLAVPIEAMAWSRFSRTENSGAKSGEPSVNEAFDLLGDGYDFMQQVLGLDSIDDNGRLLNLYLNVRYHPSYGGNQCIGDGFNAMWVPNKQSLYIPKKGLEFVEVTLHELGHGVISNGSDLEYAFQPGALNESIADTIGVSFRIWLEAGNKSTQTGKIPRDYWRMRSPDSVMRDLADPASVNGPLGPYPDHYDKLHNLGIKTDQGGVHYNSSIMNLAFYLLAEGGEHPRVKGGPSVEGIGIFKAVKIYGQAGAAILQKRSNFEDARYGFARAAELLYGKGSQEWESVHMAMDAVGIPGRWSKLNAPPQEPEPQPAPEPDIEKEPDPMPESEPGQAPKPEEGSKPDANKGSEAIPTNSKLIALLMLGVAGAIIAALAMIKMRPAYGEKDPVNYQADIVAEHATTRAENSEPAFDQSTQKMGSTAGVKNKADEGETVIAELNALNGDHSLPLREDYLIGKEGQVIGRAAEVVHIQLDSKSISRRHLRFRKENGIVTVEDLNSSRGTQVDGKALKIFEPIVLKDRQLIRIAEFSYELKFK